MALNSTAFSTRTVVMPDFLNGIQRGNQEQIALQRIPISLQDFRYSDGTAPVVTAAAGKPGIKMGGWGTGTGYFQGQDAINSTKTEYLVFDVPLPECYDDGQDIKIGVTARLNQSGGTVSVKTLDAEIYLADSDGSVGSDICATAIQTLTTSMAEYLFVVTPTGLVRGDRLRVILQTIITETANAGEQHAEIGGADLYVDIRG